jgi:peptidoglycan/xylan/chitin deacetylase (PgdA/CDA1 family)
MQRARQHNESGTKVSVRVGRAVRGGANVLRTRYPLFLLGLSLPRGEIPVFIYHDVEAATFARDLEFLRSNGYRTIGLDEFVAASKSKNAGRERRVLLTFDDARSSFYAVALPALRTFDARATLFVPSYWMQPAAVTGSPLFMDWQQVKECVQSGYVDVQSHAHRHALVATSNQLMGFATPSLIERYDVYDWPMRNTAMGERLGPPAPGTPIYRAAPLLSAQRRYVESPGLSQACTQLVSESGGQAFFNLSNWSTRLLAHYQARARVLQGEVMNAADFTAMVSSEFELARAEFTAHLGYAPTAIAYPWMLGSQHSLELARRAGFRNAFGVALDYRRARRGHLPLPTFGRLRSDWLPLLPGHGRASFLSIVARKCASFYGNQPLAH